jgi:signal transduction histidine kinase
MIDVRPSELLILNVDDYVPGRYARTKLLKQAGYPVIEAGSGREALELAERKKPALILLDVNLPDINGFEVCKQLRDNPETAFATILHISASSVLTHHQVNGLDSGADGYLVEPVESVILLATVNAFLRARGAEERLRQLNDELRWFSYRVAHDLGEPLRTITAHSQLLAHKLGSNPGPEIQKLLGFISEGAVKMRHFMDGLLEYLEAAHGQAATSPIDCESLVKSVITNLDSSIRESGATVTYDPLPSIDTNENLKYVFQNLISNAIKYRQPGVPPQIHISALDEGAAWLFTFRDNGIGIEEKFCTKVFDIFYRLHGHDVPGSGIGLALARRIVESQGGKIWVESQLGFGSTFYVRLPKNPGPAESL